jgi:ketosteroid isomerase-like protein
VSDRLATWVDGYRRAWLSNVAEDIRALFTDDAVYERRPGDPAAWRGAEAIVAQWLAHADTPGETSWEWHPLATEGDTSTIQGVAVYDDGTDRAVFDNLWVIRFAADGRARHFTEWYMQRMDEAP